jgi:hypothetical protein
MKKAAEYFLITTSLLTLVFHLLVLLKVIPYEMVWGGRLKTDIDMYRFETVSILMGIVFLMVLLMQSGFLFTRAPRMLVKIGLWAMLILLVFNTIGNLMSVSNTEKLIFTPLTFLSSVCLVIILRNKKPGNP